MHLQRIWLWDHRAGGCMTADVYSLLGLYAVRRLNGSVVPFRLRIKEDSLQRCVHPLSFLGRQNRRDCPVCTFMVLCFGEPAVFGEDRAGVLSHLGSVSRRTDCRGVCAVWALCSGKTEQQGLSRVVFVPGRTDCVCACIFRVSCFGETEHRPLRVRNMEIQSQMAMHL